MGSTQLPILRTAAKIVCASPAVTSPLPSQSVDVVSGLFHVMLGAAGSPLTANNLTGDQYLGIKVGIDQANNAAGAYALDAPNGSSYRMANGTNRGALLHDFSPDQIMGAVSLWFYDDPTVNLNEDFWVIFEGNDGSRAGIFRMVGVRNETSTSNFCYNPTGLEPDWQDSGISRGVAAWHHVVIIVNEDGLQIFLDPETESTTVIDDINIVGVLLPVIPSMSMTGIFFLLISIPFYIRLRRRL